LRADVVPPITLGGDPMFWASGVICTGVPALLVFEDGGPVDIYPHQVGDGYETIRAYLSAL